MLQHEKHADLNSYLFSRKLSGRLKRWRIKSSLVIEALDDLELMNIRPSTLYRDLEGMAWEANLIADREILVDEDL